MVLGEKHGTNYLPYTVKKRKRDLKSEQKKRRGAERLSEKRIKKIVCCSRIILISYG